jgi:hypothetical protein
MESKEKAIHSIINQVNWELVLYNVKQLNFGKQTTQKQLVEELVEILNNVIITDKKRLVTDLWTITFERANDGNFILEVMFTPIIVWMDTFSKNNKKEKVNRLEQRLKLALEIEDYEKASKIKKSLEKLAPKLK